MDGTTLLGRLLRGNSLDEISIELRNERAERCLALLASGMPSASALMAAGYLIPARRPATPACN